MSIELSAIYNSLTDHEIKGNNEKDPQKKLQFYLQGAFLIDPSQECIFESKNQCRIEEFLKCSQLWEKSGDLFKKHDISLDNLNRFGFIQGGRFGYSSTCYLKSAESQIFANTLKKSAENNFAWNKEDEHAKKLLKKALWALKGIEVSGSEQTASLKEKKLAILYRLSSLYKLHEQEAPLKKTQKKIYKIEMDLFDQYTTIANDQKYKVDWRSHMQRASHLTNAALLSQTTVERRDLLLKAEAIAKDIWYNCPSCTNYPEFSPEYKTNPEYTLLGEIQILLGHCKKVQGFASYFVMVDK